VKAIPKKYNTKFDILHPLFREVFELLVWTSHRSKRRKLAELSNSRLGEGCDLRSHVEIIPGKS
jgi:hypothetical protein